MAAESFAAARIFESLSTRFPSTRYETIRRLGISSNSTATPPGSVRVRTTTSDNRPVAKSRSMERRTVRSESFWPTSTAINSGKPLGSAPDGKCSSTAVTVGLGSSAAWAAEAKHRLNKNAASRPPASGTSD